MERTDQYKMVGRSSATLCCRTPGAQMGNGNQVTVKDVPLKCKHCGSGSFTHRRSQLNTAAMTFFNLDWLNASADIYVCKNCGFLHWFLGASIRRDTTMDDAPLPDEPVPVDDTSVASKCLSCDEAIPPGMDTCPKCGWSYRSSENAT